MSDTIASKIEEIARRVAEPEGLEVVEVEVKGGGAHRFVRISIDKPEGVTHGDCEQVSLQVGTILDVEDVVPGGRYTLEVSSPGVERKLLQPKDYQRFQGKKAKITLRDPLEGRRNWDGTLAGFENGEISLETQPGKTIRFPFDQVQKANLKFEW
jgi:ribosome maturation factor RimP